jgi:hypothetical protein
MYKIGPCHVSGIFLPLRVNSLPLATIYEVKIPLRKWKKSLLQRNPAQMTWAIDGTYSWAYAAVHFHALFLAIIFKVHQMQISATLLAYIKKHWP